MPACRTLLTAPACLACLLCLGASVAFTPTDFTLPPGFSIALYQDGLPKARSLAVSKANGEGPVIVYVASKGSQVYALVDTEGTGRPDFSFPILTDYARPDGIAWRRGSLYVSQGSRILRLDDIDSYALNQKPYDKDPAVVIDSLPSDDHGSKYIRFGRKGWLYVNIGAPCNVCVPGSYQKNDTSPSFEFGAIHRMRPDGSRVQKFASGIRNSVGFDWDPATKKLWFTDNGRDGIGDNVPDCELNYAPKRGLFFGFPFCHTIGNGGADESPYQRQPGVGPPLPDPDLNAGESAFPCQPPTFTAAAQALGPHVAPLGMQFYRRQEGAASAFPQGWHGNILVAQHGSWDRALKIGYRVMRVVLNEAGTQVVSYEPFVTFLKNEGSPDATVLGRPVDVLQLQDGSLLISDDSEGAVYRVTHSSVA